MRLFIERILGFGLIISCLLPAACSSLPLIQKPTLEIAGLRIDHMSLHEPDLGLILRVHNPNPFSISLNSLDVAIELNDRPFAEGHSTLPTTLPANGVALVELAVHAHGDALWTAVKEMMHTPGGNLAYRLRGKGSAGALDFRFSFDTTGTTDFDTLLGRKRLPSAGP